MQWHSTSLITPGLQQNLPHPIFLKNQKTKQKFMINLTCGLGPKNISVLLPTGFSLSSFVYKNYILSIPRSTAIKLPNHWFLYTIEPCPTTFFKEKLNIAALRTLHLGDLFKGTFIQLHLTGSSVSLLGRTRNCTLVFKPCRESLDCVMIQITRGRQC